MRFRRRVTKRKTNKKAVSYAVRRKPYTKKAVINRNTVVFGKGLPKKCLVTHRYVETFSMSSSVGTIARHFISCNSLYDPNATGGGHKYLYFDQMAALYNHYTVVGSKIKITFVGPNADAGITGNTKTLMVGVQRNDDTGSVGTINWTMAEQTGAQCKPMVSGSNDPVIFNAKWSAKKTFGGSVLGNDNLQGGIISSPSEQSYWMLFMQPFDIISSQSVYVLVEVEAIAMWDELKEIGGS